MAITSQAQSLTVTTEERTWRATIETPKGEPYFLSLHRERRVYDQSGAQVGETLELPAHVYKFNDIAAETVTINGTTLSVQQIAAFLTAYFDQKAIT